MNTYPLFEVILPMLVLAGVIAAITVRCVAAVFSRNVRNSILHHPVVHACRLVASLLAIAVLMAWLFPYFANRPARKANFSPEPTTARASVCCAVGDLLVAELRLCSTSGGCGSARR
jgi:hypothetical protein